MSCLCRLPISSYRPYQTQSSFFYYMGKHKGHSTCWVLLKSSLPLSCLYLFGPCLLLPLAHLTLRTTNIMEALGLPLFHPSETFGGWWSQFHTCLSLKPCLQSFPNMAKWVKYHGQEVVSCLSCLCVFLPPRLLQFYYLIQYFTAFHLFLSVSLSYVQFYLFYFILAPQNTVDIHSFKLWCVYN